MFNFIWDDKPDKIKRDISVLNYENGGIKILDLVSFITSLKTSWIKRYLYGVGKWKSIIEAQVNMPFFINCGTDYMIQSYTKLNNHF